MMSFFLTTSIYYCLIFKRSLNVFSALFIIIIVFGQYFLICPIVHIYITFYDFFYDFLIIIFLLHNSTLYCIGQHCKKVILSVCSTLFKYI